MKYNHAENTKETQVPIPTKQRGSLPTAPTRKQEKELPNHI